MKARRNRINGGEEQESWRKEGRGEGAKGKAGNYDEWRRNRLKRKGVMNVEEQEEWEKSR